MRSSRSERWVALLSALALAATPRPILAAGSRTLVQRGSQFQEGELQGVAIDATGQLVAAPRVTQRLGTGALHVWSLARDRAGRLVVGTGDGGLLFRQQGDTLLPLARTLALEILCLMPMGDDLLAGSSPDGVVYRVSGDGSTTVALDVPQQSVWDLAPGSEPGSWLAATGPGARVVRVTRAKPAGEVLLEAPALNATALLRDAGGLWIGTQSPALLYRIDGKDETAARVVWEAKEDEIRRVLPDGDGGVFVLAVGSSGPAGAGGPSAAGAAGPGASGGGSASGGSGGSAGMMVVTPPESGSGRGGDAGEGPAPCRIVWLPRSGGVEDIYAGREKLLSLAVMPDGSLVGGEAETGRIHRFDRAGRREVWTELHGGDPLALLVDPQGGLTVGTGNLGDVFALGQQRGEQGEFTSHVVEAKLVQQWGRLSLEGEPAGVTFRTRTGIRATPDGTWSDWSDPQAGGGIISSPAAPYLQYRLSLPAGHAPARVSAVALSWRERNLAPRVRGLRIEPAGGTMMSGGSNSSPEQVSQRFDDGLGVEYQVYRERAAAAPEESAWARGLRTVRWEGTDPNDDELRYALDVRREPDGEWMQLQQDLREPLFAWDTRGFTDGDYRLRVRAHDGASNSDEARRDGAQESPIVHVDNTPPEFVELRWEDQGRTRLRMRARDAASPLVDAAVRAQDGPWAPLAPEDGVLDSGQETFAARRPAIIDQERSRWIWVRAVDAAGNVALRELRTP